MSIILLPFKVWKSRFLLWSTLFSKGRNCPHPDEFVFRAEGFKDVVLMLIGCKQLGSGFDRAFLGGREVRRTCVQSETFCSAMNPFWVQLY